MLLKGPEALQLPSMAESSVLRLSPRTLLPIQKHFYKPCAPSKFWARGRQSTGPTENNTRIWQWEMGSFKNTSPWEQQADPKRNLYGWGRRSPPFRVAVQLLLGCWCPALGYLHSLLPSGSVCRRRVLARLYPTMPCHRPDQASHVTWSHLWQDLSVSKYCISRARTNSPSVA